LTKPVRFEAEASGELRDAALHYEAARLGTGTRLLADTDEVVARIAELPALGPRMPGVPEELNVRRVLLWRFPHYVAYIELENAIRVLPFAHTSRKPGYWFGRLDELARHP
jgi:toxin ParE1/3/4